MEYDSARWRKLRKKIMRRDGYQCQYLKRFGRNVPADTVHHIYPVEFYPEYKWCEWNLISLSNEAHNMMHYRGTHKLTKNGEGLKDYVNKLEKQIFDSRRNHNTV
ncbi:MAG: HNH endonuclease [Bacteroidales bacterium]|nr:HNH endonuclease [Candidatus Scybalousia scybalohippi]